MVKGALFLQIRAVSHIVYVNVGGYNHWLIG